MASSHTAPNLSSSDSVPRPSFGQTSSSPFSSPHQPLFSQKLIPRDFLGVRKSSHPKVLEVAEDTSKTIFSGNPFQNNRSARIDNTTHLRENLSGDNVGPTERPTIENPFEGENELNVPKSRFLGIDKLIPLSVKAKSISSGSPASLETPSHARTIMPRTSSIDSAISNVSTTSLSRANGESNDTSPTTVRNLIATAGGAENLVIHLLKDKNSLTSQNAQLWKLVEKQRALIFGLNKDLERLTKERDRYKKRAKELEIHTIREDASSREQITPPPDRGRTPTSTPAGPNQHIPSPNHSGPKTDVKTSVIPNGPEIGVSVPLEYANKEVMPAAEVSKPILPETYSNTPENPCQSLPKPRPKPLELGTSTSSVPAASPLAGKSNKTSTSNRKGPPTPLNLAQGRAAGFPSDQVTIRSDVEAEPDRGRRRTREEDDRDREISAKKAETEAEARSRSKKSKTPKPFANEEAQISIQTLLPAPLPTPGLPLSPRPQHAPAFAAPSVNLTVVNNPQATSLTERLLAVPLKSPGLPLSPRPLNRNDNNSLAVSLPLSPRANMGTFPLSPRAPKHALPAPTNLAAPTDASALQFSQSRSHQPSPQTITATSPGDRLQVHSPVSPDPPEVYRGLAISSYPDLLLPPNALPSIQVKVHSSRLRPSRYSVLTMKNQDDTTVFSLSIISRSSNSELWRIEKVPGALPQLEHILRPYCAELPKMPDKKLFIGQSPALLDDRRTAIDNYFEELLDTHVNEQAAVMICQFLSTDVVDPEQQPRSASAGSDMGIPSVSSPTRLSSDGPIVKTGYLTKKGKNFGGWKSRFFILDGAEFRYYESAGGPHSGTIRLQNALIGKQKEGETNDDGDGQYRHAFLIQEPKRRDSSSYTRHVLCAESDAERDEWVKALIYWVEGSASSRGASRNGSLTGASQDLTNLDTRARAGPSSKDATDTHINTPTPTSGSSIDSSILDHIGGPKPVNISGPMNGNVIADSSLWGSKSVSREVKDKTYKMGNIFGFKKPDPATVQHEQKAVKPRILRHNGYVRPVFGIPLAEAVEFCAPFNVEVHLPAVVYRCIEYLHDKNAAMEEGLFRLSGSNVAIRNLKERFNSEGDVDLVREDEYHDVHAVASLFKTYLRELPSTLLTRDLHIEFIKVLELPNHADKVAAYNALVHMLPPANLSLLKEMSKYLLEVTQSADKNKMSVRNIGIVFSPTLNIPTPVFNMFLTEYGGIFEQQSAQHSDIKTTEIKAPAALTPDDIRSPRHQMFSDLPTPAPNQTTFHNQTTMQPPRGTMTGTGELGFMPLNQIYEATSLAPARPTQPLTQIPELGSFNSLNGLLAPTNAPTERARKRQSVIIS